MLLKEQGFLCAYCMNRISNEWNSTIKKFKTEIEHFYSQELHPDKVLQYNNMLAVCNGFYLENGKSETHCDKTKDGKVIGTSVLRKLNPTHPLCEAQLKCSVSGDIKSINNDPDVEFDINDMLNLNAKQLKANRRLVIDVVARRLKELIKTVPANQPLRKTLLNKEIKYWLGEKEQKLKPFCQVAVWFLEKRMNNAI